MEPSQPPSSSAGHEAPFGTLPERLVDGADPEQVARDLVDALTPAQRLDLMWGDADFWSGLAEMLEGGYNRRPYVAGEVPELGIPGLRFTDGPRGVSLGHSTCFPVAMARGATWDPELEERVGDAIGAEARAQGANLFGGVCVNLLRHPAWGRAQETFGEDPLHVGLMGAAVTRGVQRHVMACVKHFACNSIDNARFQVDVTVSERVLHEVYLPHFKRVVDAGVAVVMSAYNAVNGEWCGQHHELLTTILKERWGFDGAVISDWVFGLRDARRGALGGLDVEMPFRQIYAHALPELVAAGDVPEARIDDAALRLVRQQVRYAGAGDPDRRSIDVVASDPHRALAREVAVESMVLLRNEPVGGAPVVPLDASSLRSVAVVGALASVPNLGDVMSSNVHPPSVVTPLEGLRAALGPDVEVAHDDGSDPSAAAVGAGAADVAIVVVGYTERDEGEYLPPMNPAFFGQFGVPPITEADGVALARAAERRAEQAPATDVAGPTGGDRRSLTLRPEDEDLVLAVAAAQPRTVVVVMAGSAVVTSRWHDLVPGLLMLWYPGMEGGHALADVLLGRADPGGRLPCVFPHDERGLPEFDPDATAVTYELLHGHRLLEASGIAPAFPFGFGRSTTTFDRTDVRVAPIDVPSDGVISVRLRVTNTGDRPGSEVVQCYARAIGSAVERPPRWLVAFDKVRLDPGQSADVGIEIPVERLAHYDETVHDFVVEATDYELIVGRHSLDPDAHVTRVRVA
ncbi:MAG: glycoside hydrolase family 3 N-terminal domain-containing protein [Acidimicrobiia bacterium]